MNFNIDISPSDVEAARRIAPQSQIAAALPRFVRRHYRDGILTNPNLPRRERKRRARILKEMANQ